MGNNKKYATLFISFFLSSLFCKYRSSCWKNDFTIFSGVSHINIYFAINGVLFHFWLFHTTIPNRNHDLSYRNKKRAEKSLAKISSLWHIEVDWVKVRQNEYRTRQQSFMKNVLTDATADKFWARLVSFVWIFVSMFSSSHKKLISWRIFICLWLSYAVNDGNFFKFLKLSLTYSVKTILINAFILLLQSTWNECIVCASH